jgi:hypothetical protein
MNLAVRSLFLSLFLAAGVVAAQSPQPTSPDAQENAAVDLAALVKQQFGKGFAPQPNFPTPMVVADFDGDGVEDAAIVATASELFPDSFEFKYKVIDPFNAFFGLDNAAITAAFSSEDPSRKHYLLVIFGAGKDGWRAAVPKAKFVMINIPFDEIGVGRMLIKKDKPPIFMIRTREYQLEDSSVYWDAKKQKWHWLPGDTLQ